MMTPGSWLAGPPPCLVPQFGGLERGFVYKEGALVPASSIMWKEIAS